MMRKTKIMMVCAFLALCGSAWAVNVNDPNLIAHWKLDETGGTTAYDSEGANNGTLIDGPVWTTGQIKGALSLDGINDYVEVGDPPDGSLDFGASDSFTISAWIKCNKIVYDSRDSVIVTKIKVSSGGTFLEGYNLKVIFGKPCFGFQDTSSHRVNMVGVTDVKDDTWHYVVGVRDTAADKVCVYVDGISDATPVTDTTTAAISTNESFGIGKHQGDYSNYFGGSIDDVRVYNRALSAEEVEGLYLRGIRELVGLEIVGPNEAPDNNSIQYTAMAIYDDNSTEDVTIEASWSVNVNDIATIDTNGVLTTGQIETFEEPISISVEYTEGGVNTAAQMDVVIYAGCTVAELISRNLSSAVEVKQRIMEDIDKALEKETRAMSLLERFAADPSISRLSRKDFVCVRNNAASAIKKEIDNKGGISQSVVLLQEAQQLITGDSNLP